MATSYPWKFFRAGGFDQVKLETGEDLMNLDQLDPKLWVALACPTTGIEFCAKTAAMIDTDGDKRIRVNELIAAVKWAGSMLKNPDLMVKGVEQIPLDEIKDPVLLASAKQILANLGKSNATSISLTDVSDANKIFANTTFNGDGIIIADSSNEPEVKAVITEIATFAGTVNDRSGKPGIDQAKADAFFTECAAYKLWNSKADATILSAGPGTSAAAAAVKAIKAKVDDYFGRCRLAAFDPRTVGLLNRSEAEYAAIATKDLSIHAGEISSFPLAQIAAGKALPVTSGINPAHAAALADLLNKAIKPLLGDRLELTEADWAELQAKLAPFEAWNAAKAGALVEKLGIARITTILETKVQEKVNSLIAQDKLLEPESAAIANVEKLVRYVRNLYGLCQNFVNFKMLYGSTNPSIFQCGTLYLDQRSCTLCVVVDNAAKHGTMAGLAGAYLAYCDCVRKGAGGVEKLSIVAVLSQGDDENLMVGRNGVFYDRKGNDYDATITKIIANPISLRQSFWSPYKKLVRMIEEQINKRAAAADAQANLQLAKTADTAANVDKAKPAAPAEKKVDVGMIAALSVAVGSIGTAMAYFLGLFKGMAFWQLPLIIMGIMLAISMPSVILAYMKLRKRNLGPILDANGWAVNAKAKINVPFGTSLTGIARLPLGATVDVSDKFAPKSSALPKLAVVLLVLACITSFLNDSQGRLWTWTEGRVGAMPSKEVLDARRAAKDLKKGSVTAPADAATPAPAQPAAASAVATPAAP